MRIVINGSIAVVFLRPLASMPRTTRNSPPQMAAPMALDVSSTESSAKKRAAPETIVLLDDDEDDLTMQQLGAQYEAAAMQEFASAGKKKQNKGPDTPTTFFGQLFRRTSRGKAKKETAAAATSTGAVARATTCLDAIDVDAIYINEIIDPSASYRRILGPLRFDYIDSFRHHSFVNEKQSPNMQKLMPKLYKELLEYRLNLPSEVTGSIFVRACESRMDIIRAVITGPDETPYANGCFLFDIYLNDYPKLAPQVNFLTTGKGKVRFNPNLYNCGKCCLSLLGTWAGPGWVANQSTLLQVLISIQGLILVNEPYYNEPGYENFKNTDAGKVASEAYSKNIRKYTLQYSIDEYLDALLKKQTKPLDYAEFESVMVQHFLQRAQAICLMMDEWVENDKKLTNLADGIRRKLLQLAEEHGEQQEENAIHAAAYAFDGVFDDIFDDGDLKPAALKMAPEILEIDD
ncbi:hypothetical protein MPSEU_000009200 [Mayamaea pseudoterrestris]|nr:hypothetical protein MPSEU_000009200 [Mayamaea pseudoterrestris]